MADELHAIGVHVVAWGAVILIPFAGIRVVLSFSFQAKSS